MPKKTKAKPRKKAKKKPARKIVTKVGKGLMSKKYKQTGKSVTKKDKKLSAKKVGWRKVKAGSKHPDAKVGSIYYEDRANRSDKNKKKKL